MRIVKNKELSWDMFGTFFLITWILVPLQIFYGFISSTYLANTENNLYLILSIFPLFAYLYWFYTPINDPKEEYAFVFEKYSTFFLFILPIILIMMIYGWNNRWIFIASAIILIIILIGLLLSPIGIFVLLPIFMSLGVSKFNGNWKYAVLALSWLIGLIPLGFKWFAYELTWYYSFMDILQFGAVSCVFLYSQFAMSSVGYSLNLTNTESRDLGKLMGINSKNLNNIYLIITSYIILFTNFYNLSIF